MVLKFQAAQRVGDVLHGVLKGVGIVVHGIDAPLVPSAVVLGVVNAVDYRVPHVEVARGQVDFRPQGHAAVLKFSGPHPAEQVQALLLGAVPVGAAGGGGQVSPHLPHLLLGQLAHIGQALLNQLLGPLVHLLKKVGAIVEPVVPVIPQPVDVLLNGVDIFHVLLGGVGVVHAQVANAPKALGCAKVHINGLGVANVQIPVGLWRKPGVHLHPLSAAAGGHVLFYKLVDKVRAGDIIKIRCCYFCFAHSQLPHF